MINNKAQSIVMIDSAFPATAIAANTFHIGLFKGAKPDFNQIFAQFSGNGVGWNALAVTALGLTQANFLGSVAFAAMTPVINVNARTLTLPFGGNASTLAGVADGTPTYFIGRILPTAAALPASWANFIASTQQGAALVTGFSGTVGAEGSDAELQFIGGQIKTGQAYRFLDLTFQL